MKDMRTNKGTKRICSVIFALLLSIAMCISSVSLTMLAYAEDENTQPAAPAADPAPETDPAPITQGVASIGDVQYATLQEAIDAAENGYTITVLEDITAFVEIAGKEITIDLNGNTVTAGESGDNKYSFLVNKSSDVMIKNGTITGGSTMKYDDPASFHVTEAKATVDNVTFKGNSGKVVRALSGTLDLNNCLFTENDNVNKASGAYVLSAFGKNSDVTAKNTVFRANNYETGNIVGALYSTGNKVTLESCDVVDNKSAETLYICNDGTITLRDTTVKSNIGSGESGGVRLHDGFFYMYDSAVYGNEVLGSSFGNDFNVIYEWMDDGEIPLPQDMKDHGVALTDYEMIAPRYGKVITKPVSKANGGERELSIEPKSENSGIAEYDGVVYDSIADAVAAMNGQPGTIKITADSEIAETITGFDGLVIDLDGHTLRGKGNKSTTLRINGGNVTVKNGTFADNKANTAEALLFQEGSGSVENINFENNSGKGLYVYHNIKYRATIDEDPKSVSISNCVFTGNGHAGKKYALSAVGASLDIQSCEFTDNYQGFRYAQTNILDNPPTIVIDDCTFTGHAGVAIETLAAMNTDVTVSNSTITDNHIANGDKYVIDLQEVDHYSGTPTISGGNTTFLNCEISNNSGSESTVKAEAGKKVFENCLIENNDAVRAGAIHADPMSRLEMRNTVIKDNHASGGTTSSSSGGVLVSAAKYVRVSMGMSGGVLVYGQNPQEIGYFAGEIDIQGGAVYNNTNDKEKEDGGARDIYIKDAQGIIYLPVYEEMKEGAFDFSKRENHDNDIIIEKSDYEIDVIFVDPIKGDDSNSGANPEKAVKTWNRASGLLKRYDAKEICVINTIKVEPEQQTRFLQKSAATKGAGGDNNTSKEERTIDLGGNSISRYKDFEGALINASNINLTITNTVIDGKKNPASQPLLVVENDATLNLGDGAVLQNNGDEDIRTSRSGGAVLVRGNMTMDEGAVIRNNAAITGGGVSVLGGNFTMNGGLVDNNKTVPAAKTYKDTSCGGGVCLSYDGTMTMNEGSISNNSAARSGGGVSLGTHATASVADGGVKFTMNGGSISNNTANDVGGGMLVQCSTVAVINSGRIENNTARSESGVFGGGGIYVNGYHSSVESVYGVVHGKLYLTNVEFTGNEAGWEGGAIGVCGSGHGNITNIDGTLIYDNTAHGNGNSYHNSLTGMDGYNTTCDVFYDNVVYPYDYENGKWITDENGHFPVVDELLYTSFFSDKMLNGASYNWKDENGEPVDPSKLHNLNTKQRLFTDATATDADVQASMRLAKVHINGNKTPTNGGGIGCNGEIQLGRIPPEEEPEPPEEEVKEEYEPPTSEAEEAVRGEYRKKSLPSEVKSAYSLKSADTGDETNLMLWALLMGISMAAVTGCVVIRRRNG